MDSEKDSWKVSTIRDSQTEIPRLKGCLKGFLKGLLEGFQKGSREGNHEGIPSRISRRIPLVIVRWFPRNS